MPAATLPGASRDSTLDLLGLGVVARVKTDGHTWWRPRIPATRQHRCWPSPASARRSWTASSISGCRTQSGWTTTRMRWIPGSDERALLRVTQCDGRSAFVCGQTRGHGWSPDVAGPRGTAVLAARSPAGRHPTDRQRADGCHGSPAGHHPEGPRGYGTPKLPPTQQRQNGGSGRHARQPPADAPPH